jgi:electron transport complex protein RnfG
MNNTAKIIIVLTFITIIAGGVLAVLDSFTRPKIEAYQNNLKNEAVSEVLPKNVKIETIEKDAMTFYKATKDNDVVGYAFQVSGGGYQSELVLMVGVSADFSEILGAKIISQVETPGLGTKIEDDASNKEDPAWFINQFKGVKTVPAITYVKNAKPSKATEIQAITGATISSSAVVDILNKGIKEAKALLNK